MRARSHGKERMDVASVLGRQLRIWRHHQRLPLKHIAHDLRVSVSTISDWERGARFPSGYRLDLLSAYTGIPAPCLLCANYRPCARRKPDPPRRR